MKKYSVLYTALILLLTNTSCSEYPRRGEAINTGAIINNYSPPDCYSINTYTNNACIVKSIADFDTVHQAHCVPRPFEFDFTKYSILGNTITYGCHVRIIRELVIDHDIKQYQYTVKYKDGGICARLGIGFNMVIVPKIPEDYSVVFKVHEE